jgi:hypothetical protein
VLQSKFEEAFKLREKEHEAEIRAKNEEIIKIFNKN